jgi:hypothetical protein
MATADKTPGMSDAAVKAKTGQSWNEWRITLDKLGAKTLDHADIVKLIAEKYKLTWWWAQGVTVGYERLTGKRALYQKKDGFAAGVSKTCSAKAKPLFSVFDDSKTRRALLGMDVVFSTRRPAKSLRFAWPKGGRVVIDFYPKPNGKTQIAVQHEKLAKARDVIRLKKFWRGVILAAEGFADAASPKAPKKETR